MMTLQALIAPLPQQGAGGLPLIERVKRDTQTRVNRGDLENVPTPDEANVGIFVVIDGTREARGNTRGLETGPRRL